MNVLSNARSIQFLKIISFSFFSFFFNKEWKKTWSFRKSITIDTLSVNISQYLNFHPDEYRRGPSVTIISVCITPPVRWWCKLDKYGWQVYSVLRVNWTVALPQTPTSDSYVRLLPGKRIYDCRALAFPVGYVPVSDIVLVFVFDCTRIKNLAVTLKK